MSSSAITKGIHHIGLTVPDIIDTGAFFVEVLAFKQIGSNPDYPALFVSDEEIIISLWQAENPDIAFPFNRKTTIGLHHFALRVSSHDDLQKLYQKLMRTDGVDVEFAPEDLGTGGAMHMMCYIPGGIRLEFISSKT